VQSVVEKELPAGGLRDQLDGPVVVGRPEATGDEAEIGLQPFAERRLELVGPVADDGDPSRLEAELQRLRGEKRPVQVCPLSPDELAAGDDDRGPRPRAIRFQGLQGRCRRR
jgi:hypothetical protein